MQLIDTHTHLYDEAFDLDRQATLERAREAGVVLMISPAIDSSNHQRMFDLCRHNDDCLPLMGFHPTSIDSTHNWHEELALVEEYLRTPPEGIERFYGVGEVGLDFYWTKDYLTEQIEAFEFQIDLARRYSLPLVIHTRAAWDRMGEVLLNHRNDSLGGILHAFSADKELIGKALDSGDYYFGIGGVSTYKHGISEEILRAIPLNRMVLETDSPYLTPVPKRGTRNESSYITYVCRRVAQVHGASEEEVARQTTLNARKVFKID